MSNATPPPPDFALLQQTLPHAPARPRRTWGLMLALVALVLGTVLALVAYLHAFERNEEARRRLSDGQWLEQSIRFHFNRLEDDLLRQTRPAVKERSGERDGGVLWATTGVVLWAGWWPAPEDASAIAATQAHATRPERWLQDAQRHPENNDALASLIDISHGLRRPGYAGPMRRADDSLSDVLWLVVPLYEQDRLVGEAVAALSLNQAVGALVPGWFQQAHRVRWLSEAHGMASADAADTYMAPMGLPGTDLFLELLPLDSRPAVAPRLFVLVALLFLAGLLAALLALRRDMAKRQTIQNLLQAQVALRTAMENSVMVGLRAWTLDGQILYVNQAFCRMVGYAAHELLGRHAPLPYWPPQHTDELTAVHRDIIDRGTEEEGVEVQFQHKDGHLIDVLIHEAPLHTASGEHVGWMSSVLDISERKRAQRLAAQRQDRLETSGRLVAMGEVASTLAHELNQPLGALSSFANGLVNRLEAGSIGLGELTPIVTRMARLADKAGTIIQRVNAFARRRELVRQPLELTGFLRHALHTMGKPPGLTVGPLPQSGALWVLADTLLLEHVVGNLVGNALDWAGRGSRTPPAVSVALDVDARSQMAAIHVGDSGPGVDQAERDLIFNAFFSTKEGGMGMGLAICRSIAEAHQGHIEVGRDPHLGGARFTLWLPLANPLEPTASPPPGSLPTEEPPP